MVKKYKHTHKKTFFKHYSTSILKSSTKILGMTRLFEIFIETFLILNFGKIQSQNKSETNFFPPYRCNFQPNIKVKKLT